MKFIIAIAITLGACQDTRTEPDASIENIEKKGIVDCNNKASKPLCKECGNGGTMQCCPSQPGWECDVLCDNWVYDPLDRTKKSCP